MPDIRSPSSPATARAGSHILAVGVLVILLLPLVLGGCSSSAIGPSGVLRLPLYSEPSTLDPAVATTASSLLLESLLYSGLVKFGPDLHVIPELAVSIPTISPDGRTYTFTVRQDARFADGHRCTASDVAYSLSRALWPSVRSPLAHQYLGNIEGAADVQAGLTDRLSGVQVVDKLTVRIRLVHPDATFLDKLAFPVAAVVDRRALSGSATAPRGDRPAGTGPWVIAGRHGDMLVLSPRRCYYGGHLHLRSIHLIAVRNPQEALELYRKGSLDAAQVQPGRYSLDSGRADFHQSDAQDAYYALTDRSDGRRLAASIDRDRLVRDATASLSPLSGIVPPAVPDYVSSPPDVGAQPPAPDGPPHVSISTGGAASWTVQQLKKALYRQWPRPAPGDASVRLIHIQHLIPDPGIWLRIVLRQTASRWFRSVLSAERQLTNDPVTRMSTYSVAENWAIKEGLVIPLASGSVMYLIKAAVEGLQVTPLGLMPDNNAWTGVSVQ